MIEIAKCDGKKCKKKKECFRYTSQTGTRQTWFNPPIRGNKCEYFWEIKKQEK